MIVFSNECKSQPFLRFKEKYNQAVKANQQSIEAISISSFNKTLSEVNSRFVNLKIINSNEFIFFTNYNSPKSIEFQSHDQIAAVFHWASINIQIRIKAKIKKTPTEYNQKYFFERSPQKNALAISSNQSEPIESYDYVIDRYKKSLESGNLEECPYFWGGYSFTPYYFEFWEGHESRLNKRDSYQLKNRKWHHSTLQP